MRPNAKIHEDVSGTSWSAVPPLGTHGTPTDHGDHDLQAARAQGGEVLALYKQPNYFVLITPCPQENYI